MHYISIAQTVDTYQGTHTHTHTHNVRNKCFEQVMRIHKSTMHETPHVSPVIMAKNSSWLTVRVEKEKEILSKFKQKTK